MLERTTTEAQPRRRTAKQGLKRTRVASNQKKVLRSNRACKLRLEFALKSESELQASRNAEEGTLEAETTEFAATMNKLVRVDDNAAQAVIQLSQQAIERGKRIFEKRRQ